MTQEIIKIVGIEVRMPYHDEVYTVGEKPEGHVSMIVKNAGIVKEIRLAEDDDSIQERDVIYIKMEKKRNNIGIIHKSTRFKNNLE